MMKSINSIQKQNSFRKSKCNKDKKEKKRNNSKEGDLRNFKINYKNLIKRIKKKIKW